MRSVPRWIWAVVSRSAVIRSRIRACRATESISRWFCSGGSRLPSQASVSAMPQSTATGPRTSCAVVAIARRSRPTSSDGESRNTRIE